MHFLISCWHGKSQLSPTPTQTHECFSFHPTQNQKNLPTKGCVDATDASPFRSHNIRHLPAKLPKRLDSRSWPLHGIVNHWNRSHHNLQHRAFDERPINENKSYLFRSGEVRNQNIDFQYLHFCTLNSSIAFANATIMLASINDLSKQRRQQFRFSSIKFTIRIFNN